MRTLQALCGWVAFGCLLITLIILGLFANPTILFAHKFEAGRITLYADRAQDKAATEALLANVSEAMDASPLGASEQPYTLYSSKSAWREAFFLGPAPKAGGVVYPPLSGRHAFLTGIDPASNRLLKGRAVIAPPRTLAFYMIHELTHVRMHEMAGTVGFYRMPHWVREGVPDYVALGPLNAQDIATIIDWDGPRFDLISRFGAYPKERAAASIAIHHLGFTAIELMSTRMEFSDILERLRTNGIGGAI